MATHEENTNTDTDPTLPTDLISEIFSRLPAEILSELQDECESWESLISSPEFIKTHLSRSTNDPNLAHHRLLLITWPNSAEANTQCMKAVKLSSFSVYSLLNDETVPETTEMYHSSCDDNIYVAGYCNGLFCLSTCFVKGSEEMFLWNPFTSESTRLPIHEHGHTARRFCYDESNDDYKVFATSGHNVSVYSSKSGRWRIIGDYRSAKICGHGSFAKGAIHWLVKRNNMQSKDPMPDMIVSLGIRTETYRQFSTPKEEAALIRSYTKLETFGESLSVMYHFPTHADFWVMKECGVEESWTKLFTIPFTMGPNLIEPLCISVHGDIMFLSDSRNIVLYNPKDNKFTNLFCHNHLSVYTYVESLVSPP